MCNRLNDSIFTKKEILEISIVPHINEETKSIDWSLSYNDFFPPLVGPDIAFLYINIKKGGEIIVQNKRIQMSDIRELTYNYICCLDTVKVKEIKRKVPVNQTGEIEIIRMFIVLEANVKKDDFWEIADWKLFFECLHELIDISEDERNKITLKLWDKTYDSLPFEKQKVVSDIIGYPIILRFQ